jgi:hypothetical protein
MTVMDTTTTPADRYRQLAVRAINDELDAEGAGVRIAAAWDAERAAWESRNRGLSAENTQLAGEVRHRAEMLGHTSAVASKQMVANADLLSSHAAMQHRMNKLHQLVSIAAERGQTTVPAAEVAVLLDDEIPPSLFSPAVVGFVTDYRYRAGKFTSADRAITLVYPFVGFSLVVASPVGACEIEPTFLVGDRALCRSEIEATKGLRLEGNLLPTTRL